MFEDFDNTNFSFNLNFMRPCFFGLEAFEFVTKMIKDLELYVLNPQVDKIEPYIPTKEELYNNWNKTNLNAALDHYNEESFYYPLEASNEVWEFNLNREKLQEKVGEEYFVSRIFFATTFKNMNAVTLTTWSCHIPNILPKTDYYLLTREYKKLFKPVKDTVLISRETFMDNFSDYFEDYTEKNCIIIDKEKANKVAKIFNGLKSNLKYGEDLERIGMENLYNAKP